MLKCPCCSEKGIPVLQALLRPAFSPALRCSSCGAKVERVRGGRDLVSMIPFLIANTTIFLSDRMTMSLVWQLYLASFVLGVALWVPFIRYRVAL